MTDLTGNNLAAAWRWADETHGTEACRTNGECAAARYILDNVEAPAPTLAEHLAHIAEHWEEWATATITSALRAAAARAEQIEQERDEARAEVKRGREIIRKHKENTDRAIGDRDAALAEVERLRTWTELVCDRRDDLIEERDEARAEVERLKAINHTPQPPHRRGLHS